MAFLLKAMIIINDIVKSHPIGYGRINNPHHHDKDELPPNPPKEDRKKRKNTPTEIIRNEARSSFQSLSLCRKAERARHMLPANMTIEPSRGSTAPIMTVTIPKMCNILIHLIFFILFPH
jgi:hypothetical protein